MSDPRNVRLIPEWGGGSLWDIGVYPLSFAQYVMGGPPEWVFGDQRRGGAGVDVAFSGTLHYADGAMAQISSAFDVPWYTHVDVLGERGPVSYTHLRAHETVLDLVCRLLLEKKQEIRSASDRQMKYMRN